MASRFCFGVESWDCRKTAILENKRRDIRYGCGKGLINEKNKMKEV